MADTAKTLGERIRQLREARDLSLREFGARLKRTAAFLSDVELGRRFPSDEVLVDMARVLGTPIEDLKKYDQRPTVQDVKRLVSQNPAYGFALRKVLDKGLTAEDLMKLADRTPDRKK